MIMADTDKKGRPAERADLDRRYGAIGISAVAAALRFQDHARPQTETARVRQEREEVAA